MTAMKSVKTALIAVAAAVTTVFLPLKIGVWLPDMVNAPRAILAKARSSDGHEFTVIQYWNRADFYNTELIHTSPDGSMKTIVLDGDDSKAWQLPMTVDETERVVSVTLGGNRLKKITW
jgi:hypothetical protein